MILGILYGVIAGGLGGCLAGFSFLMCAHPKILDSLSLPALLKGNTGAFPVPFFAAGAALGAFTALVLAVADRELRLLGPVYLRAINSHRYGIVLVTLITGAYSLYSLGSRAGPGALPHEPSIGPAQLTTAFESQQKIVNVLQGSTRELQVAVANAYYDSFGPIRRCAALILGLFAGALLGSIAAIALESRTAGLGVLFWAFWLFSAGFSAGALSIGVFGFAFKAFGTGFDVQTVVFSILNAGIPGGWMAVTAGVANFFLEPWRRATLLRSMAASAMAFLCFASLFVAGTTSRLILELEGLPASGPWSMLQRSRDSVLHILLYFEGIHFPGMVGFPAAPVVVLVTSTSVTLMIFGVLHGLNSRDNF